MKLNGMWLVHDFNEILILQTCRYVLSENLVKLLTLAIYNAQVS